MDVGTVEAARGTGRVTRAEVTGRAIGLLVFAVAAPAWTAWGAGAVLSARGTWLAVGAAALVGGRLVVGAVTLLRRGRGLPSGMETGADRAGAARARRVYGWVNAAQLVAIVVGSRSLAVAGYPQFIAALVCFCLGVHFLPLARVFRLPAYARMGWLQVGAATAGVVAAIGAGRPWLATVVPALGAAATLLGTGLVLLRATLRLTARH